MSDALSSLSERELAELSAFADGTLPPERMAAVEARVAASAELRELVDRQRRSLSATSALASEEVPESLRSTVDAHRRRRPSRRGSLRLAPRLALAVALAAAAIVAAVVLTGGPGSPTVADAARLGKRPATAPAPAPKSSTKLAADVQGVAFPNLAPLYGWHGVGVRTDRLDGHDAKVVYYAKDGRRLAYVIVTLPGLPRPSGARSTTRRGVVYQTLRVNGRLAVTWRRGGRTCVLIGDAPRSELVTLASWPLTPPR
jgi:anti-sigma factor RsiW